MAFLISDIIRKISYVSSAHTSPTSYLLSHTSKHPFAMASFGSLETKVKMPRSATPAFMKFDPGASNGALKRATQRQAAFM
jgi:hypothetical protein